MKKEIIDLAKQWSTDIKGRTIFNCKSSQIALRLDCDKSGKDIYVCYGIDGTEWIFEHFRQACVFHYIADTIGFNYELLDEYYNRVKEQIGAISN